MFGLAAGRPGRTPQWLALALHFAVADVFTTFIDMQVGCRDMQIAFTDA